MLYAAVAGRLDWRRWLGYGLAAEGLMLLFRFMCPLTRRARRYHEAQLARLPALVQRYFRRVLPDDGQS